MAKSLNVFSFSGYLGADPRLHTFDNGDQVANLSVAIADRKKDESGEWVDAPIWVDVKVRGKAAEAVGQYLTRGSFVIVTGRLAQPRRYQRDDGSTGFTQVVDWANVTFGPRVDGVESAGDPAPRQQRPAEPQAPRQGDLSGAFGDDDIPF